MPHAIPAPRMQLADLPRELVEEILINLPTKTLVQVSGTSKFMHAIATYLIFQRTRHTLEVEGYKLIYECYDPINKYNHPYTPCTYTGTLYSNPQKSTASASPPSPAKESPVDELPALPNLYSHFSPSLSSPTAFPNPATTTTLSLDTGDLFTQVCASANLVRTGPRRGPQGQFESVIPVFENFFRVRREWLDAAYATGAAGTIWVGMGEDVGLRLKVTGRKADAGARVRGRWGEEEEPAVEYGVEYLEMVVRTPYMLEMIEKRKHYSFYQNVSVVPETEEFSTAMAAPVAAVLAY